MFHNFQKAVMNQIEKMSRFPLFEVDYSRDEIFDKYLNSFRPEDNPIFRERTEHDCSCCKSFIRQMGGMVAIDKDKVITIWDVKGLEPKYQIVADAMALYIKALPIKHVFKRAEAKIGTKQNVEVTENGSIVWDHFYSEVPMSARSRDGDRLRGESASHKDSLERSITELNPDHVSELIQLCRDNNLYLGNQQLPKLLKLRSLQKEYDRASNKELFLWVRSVELGAASTIRNSVIGQVLVNMAKGDSLETAVGKYEAMTAPSNYKRSKAIVSEGMIKKAHQTVVELGLENSLLRRHATKDDITINNVLYADNSIRESLGAFDMLIGSTSQSTEIKGIPTPMGIEQFLAEVLPNSSKIEAYMENKHSANLMSLVAPVDPDAPNILQWDNNFSWTYNGEVTDSISERVKRAGGKVTGKLRVSLAWHNSDDLDLGLTEPTGEHIYFGHTRSRQGGRLDVDMNAGGRMNSVDPVENIIYPDSVRDGVYQIKVNQFSKRNHNNDNCGYTIEVEFEGQTYTFEGPVQMAQGQTDIVTEYEINGNEITFSGSPSSASKEVWGIATKQFTTVKAVSLSPNFWDENQKGNKHYFFFLEGCTNPESARGFYNEFLSDDLYEHRKVFEHLGSKLKAEYSSDQMSGLGFSSTKRNTLIMRVDNRLYEVQF